MGQFGDNVTKYAETRAKELEVGARRVVFELFRRVILKTPVDTGRARGNWQTQIGAAPSSVKVLEATDPRGSAAINAASQVASRFPIGETVWILNNLPYILVLEYGKYPDPPKRGSWVKGVGLVVKSKGGFSKQAPQGMVRVTALEFGEITKRYM